MSRLFRKTLLVIIILFGLYANSASIYSAWVLHTRMTAEYHSKAVSIAKSIASSSAEIFLTRDAATIQSLIDQYTEIGGVYYILVEDNAKEIVSHTFIPKVPDAVRAILAGRSTERKGGALAHAATQVTHSDDFIDISVGLIGGLAGHVHVGMDKKRITALIWKTIIRTQLISFFFFLVTIAITYFLIRGISRPISELTVYAKQVASHDFSASLPVHSKDEIGGLAHSMRIMASELKHFISQLEADVEKATKDLQDALTYQTAIVENLTDGLIVIDDDDNIVSSNRALQNMFVVAENQIVGQQWKTLFEADALSGIMPHAFTQLTAADHQPADSANLAPQAQVYEVTARRSDDTTFPVEISLAAIQLQDRSLRLCVIRNITLQKQMNAALRRAQTDLENRIAERTRELIQSNKQLEREISERILAETSLEAEKELLAVTMHSIADGVVGTNIDGEITLMNPVAEEILSYPDSQAVGQNFADIFLKNIGRPEIPVEDPINQVLRTRQVHTSVAEFVLTGAAQRTRHVAYSAAPIFDERRNLIGTVIVLRDQTAQRRLEAQVAKIDKIESLGVLAGGIAHDFNNILNVILGNIELANLDLNPSADGNPKLNNARKAVLRAQDLTHQLLTFSKGGAPVRKAASAGDFLLESVQFALQGSNVKCEFDIPTDLWPVDIDTSQIDQVINNLTINALQAMPAGGIMKVSACNTFIDKAEHPVLHQGRYVKIEVTDQGCGILSDIRDKIIDPYFTTKPKGSGLGLAVAYSIIHRHDGFIDFTSVIDQGTSFFFFLPAALEQPAIEPEPDDAIPTGQGKILVMDDEVMILDVVKEMLERSGYQVETAAEGTAAVEQYLQALEVGQPFDAIIMDLTIPGGMGGKAAVKKIAAQDTSVKAIASSGYSNDPVMANPQDFGFMAVVPKPYHLKELCDTIRRVILET